MATKRQVRSYSQQRLTTATFRAVESAVSFDFDTTLRNLVTGASNPYVVTGLKINVGTSTFSVDASNLTLNSLNSTLLHSTATESGTILNIPGFSGEALNSTNSRVYGSFVQGVTNYVCIDYQRVADTASVDTLYFYDADVQSEFTKLLPTSTILDYKIIINTTGFGTFLPVATVITNSSNIPTAITDCRPLLFRLGTGGTAPDPNHNYPWTSGRLENPGTSTTSVNDPFSGGDKQLTSMKDWIDAVNTSIKEIKGTSFWYSLVSSGGGSSTGGLSLFSLAEDTDFSYTTGSGNYVHSSSVTGTLSWTSDLYVRSVLSNQYYKFQTNPSGTLIANGSVLFFNLSRYNNIAGTVTIGPPLAGIPTAVTTAAGNNQLQIIKVTPGQLTNVTANVGSDVGDFLKVTSDTPGAFAQVSNFYGASGSVTNGTNATYAVLATAYTGTSGVQSIEYNQTYYTTSSISVTANNSVLTVASLGTLYWLAARNDNTPTGTIYLRSWGELGAGESRPISDNTTNNILQYIGSVTSTVPNESLTQPVYQTTISGGVTSPSQTSYGGTVGDDLTTRTSTLTSAAADQAQNKNIVFLGGGIVSDSGGTLTWSTSITVIVGGPGAGVINTIAAGSAALPSNASFGGCAYVTINRNTNGSVLAVSVTTNDQLPLGENIIVFARRLPSSTDVYVGTDGQTLLISDGTSNTTGLSPASAASTGLGSVHKWVQEIPGGTINSVNATFTLAFTPYSPTSVMIFRDGLLQVQAGASPEYSISGNIVTFTTPPLTGNELVAIYPPTQKTIVYSYAQEIPIGTVNGSNTSFTISQAIGNARGVAVYLNGLQRRYTNDFTISGTNIVFTFAPATGSLVYVYYTTSNDTVYGDQNTLNGTPNAAKTLFTYFEDIDSRNSTVVSVNGVCQFPIKNTAGSTTWTIVDYQFTDPNGLVFTSTGWAGAPPATNSLLYLWAR